MEEFFMAINKNEEGKTLEQVTNQVVKEHKLLGSIFYDDLTDKIATPFQLDADQMDKLIQKMEDSGVSVVDADGGPTARQLKTDESKKDDKKEKEKAAEEEELSAPAGVKINDPGRMYLKESGRVS